MLPLYIYIYVYIHIVYPSLPQTLFGLSRLYATRLSEDGDLFALSPIALILLACLVNPISLRAHQKAMNDVLTLFVNNMRRSGSGTELAIR